MLYDNCNCNCMIIVIVMVQRSTAFVLYRTLLHTLFISSPISCVATAGCLIFSWLCCPHRYTHTPATTKAPRPHNDTIKYKKNGQCPPPPPVPFPVQRWTTHAPFWCGRRRRRCGCQNARGWDSGLFSHFRDNALHPTSRRLVFQRHRFGLHRHHLSSPPNKNNPPDFSLRPNPSRQTFSSCQQMTHSSPFLWPATSLPNSDGSSRCLQFHLLLVRGH